MVDQDHGDDERDIASMIVFNHLEQLFLFFSREVLLEITHDVHQDIGVLLWGCQEREPFHEQPDVDAVQFIALVTLRLCDKLPQNREVLWTMGKEKKLVVRVKIDESTEGGSFLQEGPPPFVDKDPFNEVLPETEVVKSSIVNDGDRGETAHKGPGEDSDTPMAGHP